MLTGRDPGELGIYGFRSRRDRSYDAPALNDAGSVNAPALWDLLGSEGFESIVVGNPAIHRATRSRRSAVTW
jgi:predicted AlkP superfamily phosphohydrolase/phosphomutase